MSNRIPRISDNDMMAQCRELGFLRGLQCAQKIAKAQGDMQTYLAIGAVSFSDTFTLANTKADPHEAVVEGVGG